MPENTLARVQTILADQLGFEEASIQPTSSLEHDLGADSLDHVEIVMAIEEEFEFEIPDDDAETLKTVEDIVDFVNSRA